MDHAGIPYMLAGSLSSMYYAFPRATVDADFVIGVQNPDLFQLAQLLGSDFIVDRQTTFETVGGFDPTGVQP